MRNVTNAICLSGTRKLNCRLEVPHEDWMLLRATLSSVDHCADVESDLSVRRFGWNIKMKEEKKKMRGNRETKTRPIRASRATHTHTYAYAYTHTLAKGVREIEKISWIQNCFRFSFLHVLLCSHVPNTLYTHILVSPPPTSSSFSLEIRFCLLFFFSSLFTTDCTEWSDAWASRLSADKYNMSYDTVGTCCIHNFTLAEIKHWNLILLKFLHALDSAITSFSHGEFVLHVLVLSSFHSVDDHHLSTYSHSVKYEWWLFRSMVNAFNVKCVCCLSFLLFSSTFVLVCRHVKLAASRWVFSMY